MNATTILALVNAVPGIFAAAQTLRASLSTDDQATLDTALAAAQAAASADIDKAAADLASAGAA